MISQNQSQIYSEQLLNKRIYTKYLRTASQQYIHWSYLSTRVLLGLRVLFLIILAYRWSLEPYHSFFNILQYLTQLGFNTTLIYFTLVCLDFVINHKKQDKICPQLSLLINLLFQIAFCFQVPITIIFWSLLFDYNGQHTSWDVIKNFGVHGFPLVCLLIDFIFNVYDFPKSHLFIVIGYGVFYLIVNIKLGYSLTIAPIYKPIDWVSLMSYVWILVCLFLVLIVHRSSYFIWIRYKLPRLSEFKLTFQKSLKSQSIHFLQPGYFM